MSGLLRRIKRSRPADAGEPLPEGQAAAPEGGAAPQGEAAPADTGTPAAPRAWLTTTEPEQATPAEAPKLSETPTPPATPETPKPVLVATPGTPAGLELENQTTPRAPSGRRGRLRRRLRYLRRARELMLRDLGGLLYEVHRSGGGNIDAHATVLTTKVQRISGLDAEAHALETALASPRPDALIFEPGIGGTCPNCGELFSSDAHFCANCGASVTDLPQAPPAPVAQLTMDVDAATPAPVVAPLTPPDRRRFWQRVAGNRRTGAPADAAPGAEGATQVLDPAAQAESPATTPALPATGPRTEPPAAGDAPADDAGRVEPADAPQGEAAPGGDAPAAEAAPGDAPQGEVAPGSDAPAAEAAPGDAPQGELAPGSDAPQGEIAPSSDAPAGPDEPSAGAAQGGDAPADGETAGEAPAEGDAHPDGERSNGRAGDPVASRRARS